MSRDNEEAKCDRKIQAGAVRWRMKTDLILPVEKIKLK